jgi:hypothetical protein
MILPPVSPQIDGRPSTSEEVVRFIGWKGYFMGMLDGWEFHRSTAAFEVVNGVLVSVAADTPRLGSNGLLIESERTNLFVRSQDFAHSSWAKVNCTIGANAATAPDGTVTADKLIGDSLTAAEYQEQVVACTVGARQTISIFAKAVPGETRWLYFRTAEGTAPIVWFDLENGVVGNGDVQWLDPRIEAFSDGWYRVSASIVAIAASHTLRTGASNTDATMVFTGDGLKGILLWGAQWEEAFSPSSYIETQGSAATRAADEVSRAWAPEASGFLYIEYTATQDPGGAIVTVVGSPAAMPIYVANGAVGTSNGDEALMSGAIVNPGEVVRAALTWGLDGRKISAQGDLAKDANDIGAITELSLGDFRGSSTYVHDLALVDDIQLSDEAAAAMTGGGIPGALEATLLTISATANAMGDTKKTLSGQFDGTELFYAGQQGYGGQAPGSGVLGVVDPTSNRYVELTHYAYGATLKHDGQILELFLNSDPNGIADLSVRGIVVHHGSRVNARNGADTISTAIASIDDRAGLLLTGNLDDMPTDMRIGHAREDGAFAFVTGISDWLDGGTVVARIGEEGLQLKHRSTAPTPPVGHSVIWAKDDGTIQATANVGGVTTTTQL